MTTRASPAAAASGACLSSSSPVGREVKSLVDIPSTSKSNKRPRSQAAAGSIATTF